MNHRAPRSQWLAISFLAVIIFIFLLARFHRGLSPRSSIENPPVFVGVEGSVKQDGVYLLEGPHTTIGRAIESAGGLQNSNSNALPEDLAMMSIGSGRVIQVEASGSGPLEIHVKMMPAAARLTLGEKLDLNVSSEEDLMLVPQMKAGFAESIVERRLNKPWRSLEELQEIPGVGPKTIERWKDCLTLTDKP